MNDLGTFNDELIRLGPEDGNHMDMTADGIDLLEGNTSVANFTRSGSRMGEADKGHVETTSQGVFVFDGDFEAIGVGLNAVDTSKINHISGSRADGLAAYNGAVAANGVFAKTGMTTETLGLTNPDDGWIATTVTSKIVSNPPNYQRIISFGDGTIIVNKDGTMENLTTPLLEIKLDGERLRMEAPINNGSTIFFEVNSSGTLRSGVL